MSMRVGTILAVAAVAALGGANMARAASTGTGNVFSDAAFWYSGAFDANGDKLFTKGDLRDVRHVADSSHALNQSYYSGAGSTGLSITNMPVIHPHAQVTNADETCVYFRQPVKEDLKIYPVCINLPNLFTFGFQSNFTFVTRVRWEGPTHDGANSYLFCMNGKGGFRVGISSAGTLRAQIMDGSSYPTVNFSTETSVAIHSNVWVDLAVTVGDGAITTYRAMDDYVNGYWYKNLQSLPAVAKNDTTNAVSEFTIGAGEKLDGKSRTYSAYPSLWTVFRGQMQQFAVWNRKLSDAEVAEVFGCTADKLRFGVPDGASGEFAGEMASGTPEKPEDWCGYAPTLTEASPTLTLGFTLAAHETDIPYNLSILSVPSSAEGRVALAVNGQHACSRVISPGVARNLFVKKKFLSEGANTLTLTWQGAGTFTLDALTLGGSWQIGLADGSNSEIPNKNRYRKTYYLAGMPTWTRFNGSITSEANYEDNTIVFPMTAAMAAGAHVLEIPFTKWSEIADASIDVRIKVNGEEKLVFPVTSNSWGSLDTLKLKLPDGVLVPGANTIELRNMYDTANSSVRYDYIRLRAVSPEANSCVTFK